MSLRLRTLRSGDYPALFALVQSSHIRSKKYKNFPNRICVCRRGWVEEVQWQGQRDITNKEFDPHNSLSWWTKGHEPRNTYSLEAKRSINVFSQRKMNLASQFLYHGLVRPMLNFWTRLGYLFLRNGTKNRAWYNLQLYITDVGCKFILIKHFCCDKSSFPENSLSEVSSKLWTPKIE